MKIASPQIVHKSDAGGVKVNLTNDEEVRSAFKEIVENPKNMTATPKSKEFWLLRWSRVAKR